MPAQVELALKRVESQELIRLEQQGLGNPIISANLDGHQVVAVRNTIYYSKTWRFFPDFLSHYVKEVFGGTWGNAEIAKPLRDRHPIMQWYDSYCRFQRQHDKNSDGTYSAVATGAVYCFLGLAYNLYLLKHNAELKDRLVARLKQREQFQGAYYELIVANCLIRSGFELRLEDETDESVKHCEFSAVSKHTGKKYWVEAKMRSVSGLLGKTKMDGGTSTSKPTSRLSKHLGDALKKPAADERLIFIDVNTSRWEVKESTSGKVPNWIEAAAKQLDDREKYLKEGEQAYVFVTNMPFHRALDEAALGHAVLAYGLGIADFAKPGQYRLSEIWRRKQKHIDAHHILEALSSYPKIPNTFDGSLPLAKCDAENRIEIGGTYFFEDIGEKGLLGEVTAATVSESQKKIYIGVTTEENKSIILSRDISDEELASYRDHPDAYFAVVQRAPKGLNSVYELFEWMVDCHRETPKARLLEMIKGHPNFEALTKLDHLSLVLEVCEGLASAQKGAQQRH